MLDDYTPGEDFPDEPQIYIIKLSEKFEKISSFYQTKKSNEWQPKNCIFRIITSEYLEKKSTKILAEKKFDMSTCIDTDNNSFELDMGKGFSIEMRFKIRPACKNKDETLFKSEIE